MAENGRNMAGKKIRKAGAGSGYSASNIPARICPGYRGPMPVVVRSSLRQVDDGEFSGGAQKDGGAQKEKFLSRERSLAFRIARADCHWRRMAGIWLAGK